MLDLCAFSTRDDACESSPSDNRDSRIDTRRVGSGSLGSRGESLSEVGPACSSMCVHEWEEDETEIGSLETKVVPARMREVAICPS